MNYGSVCSGVEAASLAWKPLGWTAKFFAEVEPFPSAVLCERFGATRPMRPLDPAEAHSEKDRKLRESWAKQIAGLPPCGTTPNLGDFPKIKETDYNGEIDLLVGGCPCQSYSLAGLRKGLADPRGNLTLEFVKLAYRTGARILVFENVPGILSSGDCGSDFAGFLSLLCGWEVKPPKDGWRKCGIVTNAPGCFGVAWRILDAQYTRVPEFPRAVPQRRRRLILVGHLDNWLYPAKVLFDGEMCGGDTPPRRTKRERLAADPESGADPAVPAHRECIDIRQINVQERNLAPTLIATDYKGGKAVSFYSQRKAESMVPLEECSNTLVNGTCPGHQNAVCFEHNPTDARLKEVPVSPTVLGRWGTGGNQTPVVLENKNPSAAPDENRRDEAQRKDGEPSKNGAAEVIPKQMELVAFIKNDAGGDQDGYWEDVFPTVRSQVTPAVAYNVTFCDANGTRKDRPDGGLYVTPADASKTVTTGGTNAETVVVALDGDKMGKAERKGGSGLGVSEDEVMYTQTVKDVHAVAYTEEITVLDMMGSKGHCNASQTDVSPVITTPHGMHAVAREENINGNATETNPRKILCVLRKKIGKDAFRKWAAGRLKRFFKTEVLQPSMYGEGLRQTTDKKQSAMDDSALSCEEIAPQNALFDLWINCTSRHTPPGRKLEEQFLDELDVCLSKLSSEDTPWGIATVRRLLPIEAERLMGFPDNHTRIPWKGLPEEECPDAPRYKACGNSMCVNVMAWVGQRIQMMEREIPSREGINNPEKPETATGVAVFNPEEINE